VLVDEPGWAVEYARLTRMGMRLLPVPRGPDGPDLGVLAALLRDHRPRLYVTVSVLHNPTGQSLTAACAHQVLRLAEGFGLTIVEDDTYAWLAARMQHDWRSWTACNAPSTSRVFRRSWCRSGASASSQPRLRWRRS
jgi:DNA-binding transcriptional MocR family regulator